RRECHFTFFGMHIIWFRDIVKLNRNFINPFDSSLVTNDIQSNKFLNKTKYQVMKYQKYTSRKAPRPYRSLRGQILFLSGIS
ncbi:hypothetical protein, partial [Termitidicoccus mucosus]|uniref:hypothetical protein n=1 Tax=Termitidicoccus mucosus TaxID=1184151 RepID=UPI002FEE51C5